MSQAIEQNACADLGPQAWPPPAHDAFRCAAASALRRRRALSASALRASLVRLQSHLRLSSGTSSDLSLSSSRVPRSAAARYDALSEALQLSARVSTPATDTSSESLGLSHTAVGFRQLPPIICTSCRKTDDTSFSLTRAILPHCPDTVHADELYRTVMTRRAATTVRKPRIYSNALDWVYDRTKPIPNQISSASSYDVLAQLFPRTFSQPQLTRTQSTPTSTPDVLTSYPHCDVRSDDDTDHSITSQVSVQNPPASQIPTTDEYQRRTYYRSSRIDERRAPNAPWPSSQLSSRTSSSNLVSSSSSSHLPSAPHHGYGMYRIENDIPTRLPADPSVMRLALQRYRDHQEPYTHNNNNNHSFNNPNHTHTSTSSSMDTMVAVLEQSARTRAKHLQQSDHDGIIELHDGYQGAWGVFRKHPRRHLHAHTYAFFQPNPNVVHTVTLGDFVFEIGPDGRVRRQRFAEVVHK